MRRRLVTTLILSVIVAASMLGLNLGFANTPKLGLDLQGGVSVILAPAQSAESDDLETIRGLINTELEDRGIAEPQVRIEGSNIVVELPGVKDQQEALDAVDIAGIVYLRPVLGCTGPIEPVDPDATTTTVLDGSTPGTATDTSVGDTATDGSAPTTTPGSTAPATGSDGSTPGSTAPSGLRRAATTPTTVADTAAPTDTAAPSSSAAPTDTAAPGSSAAPTDTAAPGSTTPSESTVPGDSVPTESVPLDLTQPSDPTQQAFLPLRDNGGFCQVGPSGGTGEVFTRGSATAEIQQGGWGVAVELSSAGEPAWNALASQCFARAEPCPSGQLAIELDGEIQSAPVVQAPSFSGSVSITGDFEESEARELARVLRRGAFPVNVEAQTVQTISPTLGKDSLRAAVIAGIAGVLAVLVFLVAYYRRLAVVVVGGLLVWGMIVWSLTTMVSNYTNYTLSLAGVTGMIVAVGVTVDTYVVFFERLKDEVRSGRTLRNSAMRGFKATWRTIVTADLVSLLAAAVLFVLSVGSVKGFALYLGLTTVCDLIVCYFVTRPAVVLLCRSRWFEGRRVLGLGATA